MKIKIIRVGKKKTVKVKKGETNSMRGAEMLLLKRSWKLRREETKKWNKEG